MRVVGGGGVSQPRFAAVNELRSIREMVPCKEKQLFSIGAVVIDPEQVGADFGLERGGRRVVGEMEGAVVGMVVTRGGVMACRRKGGV